MQNSANKGAPSTILPMPDGGGDVRGGTTTMPDRGTTTGVGDNCAHGGHDLSHDATNRIGGMRQSTSSSKGEKHVPERQRGRS
jgi:hypothetical protein